jgi:hypothetical protein
MDDRTIPAALEQHWDVSGERIHGRRNIQESRLVQPNKKRFTVRRMIGAGDLWVTELYLPTRADQRTP